MATALPPIEPAIGTRFVARESVGFIARLEYEVVAVVFPKA